MPSEYFKYEAEKYIQNGYIRFDDILKLSDYFGVSCTSCVFTAAYRHNLIEGDTSAKELRKRIRKYKPDKKRLKYGVSLYTPQIQDQIINSYTYFFKHDLNIIWFLFKRDYIYNENRIEGGKLEVSEIAEIITDLRLNKQNSKYCKINHQDVVETAGQSALYDYVFQTTDAIDAYSILKLHRKLYQYAPYPESGGVFRQTNNLVTHSNFDTTDYKKIITEVQKVDLDVKMLVSEKDSIPVSEFIERALIIHHRFTVIHPFHDGNGRVSRLFLNWLFRLKGLPPVYLKYKDKERYYEALQKADNENNYEPLKEVFYTEIIRTMIQLYDGRRVTENTTVSYA
ncbi:putative adenosine monophosphate-protein transferase aq aa38 [Haloplasma contractile SSD-17B]|uniref:Adenosine monophosphate-protein transferase aq aa38 n=2 Tax=Haloplasma TaxID=471824 RepID=U2FDM9_9MOLU|nr:putative adenosine monophosphate-protein transferase aq aa38 [Haloplasma contractile SSD-17B]